MSHNDPIPLPAIQLTAIDGRLYYPAKPCTHCKADHLSEDGCLCYWCDGTGSEQNILLCVYPAGDCDTICWPNPNRKNLHAALFDDRECGTIDDQEVLLPDGTSAWARSIADHHDPVS